MDRPSLFVKRTNVKLRSANFVTLTETLVFSALTSIMSTLLLIRPVFLTYVPWRTVRNVKLILRSVNNVNKIQSTTFPPEGVSNLPSKIVPVSVSLKKVLNVGTVKVDSKLTILHGINVKEFVKTQIVLTVLIVH